MGKRRVTMLSTVDNPYDPIKNYPEWEAEDQRLGHHSGSYLARVAVTSSELSDSDYDYDVEKAIDEIVAANLNGKWIKVVGYVEE